MRTTRPHFAGGLLLARGHGLVAGQLPVCSALASYHPDSEVLANPRAFSSVLAAAWGLTGGSPPQPRRVPAVAAGMAAAWVDLLVLAPGGSIVLPTEAPPSTAARFAP